MAKKVIGIIGNVLWKIMCVLFVLILIATLWLVVDKFILKSPVPSIFGYSCLTIETGSMQGTIDVGDAIIIRDTDDYKIGDVVTFMHKNDKIPTTHRIINKDLDGFVTKGDANNTEDTKRVTSDNILGEVVAVWKNAGHFIDWLRQEGWIYAVCLFGIFMLGSFILKLDDENNNTKGEGDKTEESANTDGVANDTSSSETNTECADNNTEDSSNCTSNAVENAKDDNSDSQSNNTDK